MAFDKRAYDKDYIEKQLVRVAISFNRNKPEDMDMLEHMRKQPEPMAAYIRRLIRDDMQKTVK